MAFQWAKARSLCRLKPSAERLESGRKKRLRTGDQGPIAPISLVDAASLVTALPPTIQRIAGSRPRRSASLTSSYPARRPNTDCRNCAAPVETRIAEWLMCPVFLMIFSKASKS